MHTNPIAVANVTSNESQYSAVFSFYSMLRPLCREAFSSVSLVIKLFSFSTQLSLKCILLINGKMPRLVCILTFISIINTTSEN